MQKYHKPRSWTEQKHYRLNCARCGQIFYAAKPYAKYCSPSHSFMSYRDRKKANAGN